MVIITGAFILYFTRSQVDFYINNLEVSMFEFSSSNAIEFGELSRLKKIDLYNSEIEISNLANIKSSELSLPIGNYNRIVLIPENDKAQFTIDIREEMQDLAELNFVIKDSEPPFKPLKTIAKVNKNPKTNITELFLHSLELSSSVMPNEVTYDGGIYPIPGQKNNSYEYRFFSKSLKIKLIDTGKDTVEFINQKDAELRCLFSKYTKISFKTFAGTDGAQIRFFMHPPKDTVKKVDSKSMHILRKGDREKNVEISDPKFVAMQNQEDRVILSYSSKKEFLPVIRTNDRIFIDADKLILTDDVKLISDVIYVSLKGRSNDIVKEQTQLVDSNFDRFPKILSVIVIILAYVLDKVITILNFLQQQKK